MLAVYLLGSLKSTDLVSVVLFPRDSDFLAEHETDGASPLLTHSHFYKFGVRSQTWRFSQNLH